MLFSLISMNNTSFKLFYLLSVLWKTRPRKEIQASRQNIILIAQTWLKAEKYFKSRENHKKKTKPPNQKPKKKPQKPKKQKTKAKKECFAKSWQWIKLRFLVQVGKPIEFDLCWRWGQDVRKDEEPCLSLAIVSFSHEKAAQNRSFMRSD